jgi:hypothetical protein
MPLNIISLVPGAGIEPARGLKAQDFNLTGLHYCFE